MAKWIDATDPKWGHPELVEAGLWSYEAGLDPWDVEKMTPEEQEASRRVWEAESRAAITSTGKCTLEDYYTEHGCPEEPDAPPVRVVVAKPVNMTPGEKYPVMFSIGSGGIYAYGTAETALGVRHMIEKSAFEIIQISLDYRLTPYHPYPAAINDIHAAYMWMLEHAEELQIDTDRILIQGVSAGGHLSLAFAFRLQRYDWCGAPMPRGIVAETPSLDSLELMDSFQISFKMPNGKTIIPDGPMLRHTVKMWLGDRFEDLDIPPEALPPRATIEDLEKGYPPVWIPVIGEFEPHRDPIYKFVALLHEAHIFCELHEWGGMNHMFDSLTGTSDVFQRMEGIVDGCVKDALTYDFRRPWLFEKK